MSNFKTPLVMASLPDGRKKRVHTKFTYRDRDWNFMVPAGFVSDGASIPKILWPVIGGPWGRYGKAAVLHDFLYQRWGRGSPLARREADRVFFRAMKLLGVKPWRRNLMYWGVRAVGWLAWRKKR